MNQKLKAQIVKTLEGATPFFFEQDNFMACVLMPKDAVMPISVGMAKRNPNCDEPDPNRARDITLSRAVQATRKKKARAKPRR